MARAKRARSGSQVRESGSKGTQTKIPPSTLDNIDLSKNTKTKAIKGSASAPSADTILENNKAIVVNAKTDEYDIFIGRPSILGNPFKIGQDGTREEVIEKYRQWFYAPQRRGIREFAKRRCTGKRCGCFCAPEPCHGDVIIEFVNNDTDST